MAPNNVMKSAFISKSDCDSPKEPVDQNSIRTDFVLQNVFAHVVEVASSFTPMPAVTDKEKYLLPELLGIIDDFNMKFRTAMRIYCLEAEFGRNTIGSYLQGVANELFSEGISWGRIVAFFAFIGEYTAECLKKGMDYPVADVIYACFREVVKESLNSWIDDHGGWDGILILSHAQGNNTTESPRNGSENLPLPNGSVKGWTKSLLHGTVRMIGTLAQIANSTQGYP